jgi:hypothetical protein
MKFRCHYPLAAISSSHPDDFVLTQDICFSMKTSGCPGGKEIFTTTIGLEKGCKKWY